MTQRGRGAPKFGQACRNGLGQNRLQAHRCWRERPAAIVKRQIDGRKFRKLVRLAKDPEPIRQVRRGSRTYPKARLDRCPKARQAGTRKCDPPRDSGGIKRCNTRFPENTGRFKQHQRNRLRRIPGTFRISDPYHRQGRQPFCSPDRVGRFPGVRTVRRCGRHSRRRGSAGERA